MSGRVWNQHQAAAIAARGKSIVVSAAAGSGKTSVLSERVLSLIEEGEDIERMLIVTFTNLAAGEMRERIYKRLHSAGADGKSSRLAAQAEKCVFADISTIHAFCNKLVRDNFEYAGVSPTFAVGSEAETALLRQRVLDAVIEDASSKPETRVFLSRYAPRGNMYGIQRVVTAIYHRVISMKDPQKWLSDAAGNYTCEAFVQTLFGAYKDMVLAAAVRADGYLKQRSEIWELRGFPEQAKQSENERLALKRLANSITIENAVLPEIAQISVQDVKGTPGRESKSLTARANKALTEVSEYATGFAGKVRQELAREAEDGRVFIALVRDFMKRYTKRKREKNVLDHDDALHFALRALQSEVIAQRYRDKYAHVFVDEYQDINNVQSEIIRAILRGGNDFFVGDVKQCIYMFRESNPGLLMRRCDELRNNGLIEMNMNYRSMPAVIGFINGVMRCMMSEHAGGVDYTAGQVLCAGAEGDGNVRVVLAAGEEDATTEEARKIAAMICELHNSGYEYKDIAVLRPEVSSTGAVISRVLAEAGIPAVCGFDSADSRFGEGSVFVNLLCLIDGSGDDIALLSVMRYPYFGFTEPELASIRIWANETLGKDEDKSFAHAARSYDTPGALADKLYGFWRTIAYYRMLADSLTMSDLMMRLRHEAMFEAYALTSPAGKGSDDAIRAFIREVSAMDALCVSDVLELADRVLAQSGSTPSPGETDAVYITTIHKSKGLEFGAVILSGMHKKINQTDTSGTVLVGRELGLALDIVDGDTRVKTSTLHKRAVVDQLRREKISETVRLLYVGMTRAKQMLILCGAGGEIKTKWTEEKADGWQFDVSTYLDLVMPALTLALAKDGRSIEDVVEVSEGQTAYAQGSDKAERLDALIADVKTQMGDLAFAQYMYSDALGIPSKLSVSTLKRMSEPEQIRPVFLPSDHADISAAQRGTLMHKVLQMTELKVMSEAEVEAHAAQLVADGVIAREHEEHVNMFEIARFLQSDIAARARASERRMLEASFCLTMPACEAGICDSGEQVVVQGVIDLCFIEDGQWVVVDYKTDRVTEADALGAAQKYRVQLDLYEKALSRISNKPVKQKFIYYLRVGTAVMLR